MVRSCVTIVLFLFTFVLAQAGDHGGKQDGWAAAKPELEALKAEFDGKKQGLMSEHTALHQKQKDLEQKRKAQKPHGKDRELQSQHEALKRERQALETRKRALHDEFKQRWNAILKSHGVQPKGW
jgi:Skp family chaperone for outer membrane proteins